MTDLLAERFEPVKNQHDDSDWLAVRRAARRSRPRLVLAAAAAVAAAILVTPAFGLGGRLLDLIDGSPAPPEVQTYFAHSNKLRVEMFAAAAAAGHQLQDRFSRVVADKARGVAAIGTPDGPIYLWAAPTEDGRQCWLIQAGAEIVTGRPYGFGACDPTAPQDAITPELLWTQERPTVRIVHVRVYDDTIRRVEVDVQGAAPVSLPVASGHALGTVPKESDIVGYVARNADGDVVARRPFS